MADTGKIVVEGFSAGAIKYVVLEGYAPNPAAPLTANLITMGFGTPGGRLVLDGFWPNAVGGGGSSGGCIFGGAVITGYDDWRYT